MTVSIRTVQTEIELRQALALAADSFPSTDRNSDYKSTLWLDDPSFKNENVFVAVDAASKVSTTKVCGLIRVVNRRFALPSCTGDLQAACLSSVCVDPAYRGQGVSRKLHESVLKELDRRGVSVGYLIARRAVDHYYSRFGFWGVSAYETVRPNTASGLLDLNDDSGLNAVQLSKIDTQVSADVLVELDTYYTFSYGNTWGRAHRQLDDWRSLLKRLAFLGENDFSLIRFDGALIGYVIRSASAVLELGFCPKLEPSRIRPVLNVILSGLKHSPSSPMTLNLPHRHEVLSSLKNDDIQYSFRSCVFGGHMVRVINRETVIGLRDRLNLPPISDRIYSTLSDADRVCCDLGFTPPWESPVSGWSRFNLSYPEIL